MSPYQQIKTAIERANGMIVFDKAMGWDGHGRAVRLQGWSVKGYILIVQVSGDERYELFAPVSHSNKIADDVAYVEALGNPAPESITITLHEQPEKDIFMLHMEGFTLSEDGKEMAQYGVGAIGHAPFVRIKDGKHKGKTFLADLREIQKSVEALFTD